MNQVSRYYEHYWSAEGVVPKGLLLSALRGVIDEAIPIGATVLDVGCGDGQAVGPYLKSRDCSYIGVDVSENALERAASSGLEVRLIDDASTLPWPNDSFDAVVSMEVLEHLFDPMAALVEFRRVLRAGGILFVTVPNVAYWTRRAELGVLGRWNPLGDEQSVRRPWRDPHLRFFTTASLRSLLGEAKFEGIDVGGHSGSALAHLPVPWRRARDWKPRASFIYRKLERWMPSVFGYGLYAVARTPSPASPL